MAVPTFTDQFAQADPIAPYVDQAFALAPAIYLRLGDTVGSGTAADSSGNGNNGGVTGGVTFGTTGLLPGDADTAAIFDGSTGFITVPSSPTWHPTSALSISVLVNFPTSLVGTSDTRWISGDALNLSSVLGLGWTSAQGTFVYYQGSDSSSNSFVVNFPVTLNNNTTYHIVVTDDGSTLDDLGIKCYVNGVLVGSQSRLVTARAGGFQASTSTLLLGKNAVFPGFYGGTMDEYALYPNIVLSPTQIAQMYAARTVVTPVAWTALTGRGGAVSWTRGKQHELDQIQTGTANAQLRNIDRALDPTNTASPYYPNVKPMRRYRRQATINSTTYTCFTGFVSQWPQARTGPTYAEVPLQAVDGLELLNQAIIVGSFPQEQTGARVNRVLNLSGWTHAARSIDTGASQVQAVTFAATDQQTALAHIIDVAEQSERGLFFIAGNGQATFIDRYGLLTSPYNVSQATFSDTPGGGEFGYQSITPSFDRDLIWNDWNDTRTGGIAQEASDAASIQSYFRRSQSLTSQLASDTDSAGMVAYMLSQYKDAYFRVDEITLHPGTSTAFWQAILAREIGDRITVKESPPGGGAQIVKDCLIAQMNVSVPLHAADTVVTWQLLSVDPMNFLVLDDATRGQLDSNKLAW